MNSREREGGGTPEMQGATSIASRPFIHNTPTRKQVTQAQDRKEHSNTLITPPHLHSEIIHSQHTQLNTPTRKRSHLAHVHNTLHSQHTNTQTVTPSHARGSSLVLLLFNTTRARASLRTPKHGSRYRIDGCEADTATFIHRPLLGKGR